MMTKPLTDTQRAILRGAAAHPHGFAAPPTNLPPAPRQAIAKGLLATGLLARAEGAESQHPSLSWKLDGGSVLLRITEAGLQAIGAAPVAASPEPQRGSVRQALAEPAVARSTSGPRPPRTGTKQAAVLALLHRPEGASGPAIVEATGWAPHTVRGFLAGLKQRGVAVQVHERVRQAGPSKAGAKGSYSVYRIAEAG